MRARPSPGRTHRPSSVGRWLRACGGRRECGDPRGGGLLTGLGTAVSLNDISEVLPVTGAFLAQLPAVFVLIGVTVALMGWVPRWSAIAWAAFGIRRHRRSVGRSTADPALGAQHPPFDHIPLLPAEPMRWLPIVVPDPRSERFWPGLDWLVGIRRRDIG